MENSTSLFNYDYYIGYNDSGPVIYVEHAESSSFGLFSVVCYSLIFCLSMPGNTFLLWVLLRKRGRKTTSDFLLLHLTASDLCFTVTLPFWAYYHLHGWIFGDWACKIVSGLFFLGLYSYMAFLTAMTLDRYVAVVHAVSMSAQARRRFCALLACTGTWLLCAAASLVEMLNSATTDDGYGGTDCVEASGSQDIELSGVYFQICLFFLIPFSVIAFCYVRMGMTIRQCRLRGRNQALGLLLGVILSFFVCWAPYNMVLFLESLKKHGVVVNEEAMVYGYFISHTLAYCHCCLNPLFHVFGAEMFRKHLPMPCSALFPGRGRSQSVTSISSRPHPPISQTFVQLQ